MCVRGARAPGGTRDVCVCEGCRAPTETMRLGGAGGDHHRGGVWGVRDTRPPRAAAGPRRRLLGARGSRRPGRTPRRRALTGLCGGVLGAALEGEAEEQLVAAAARAHQDNADGAGALAHAGAARPGRARRKAARCRRLPLPPRYPGPARGSRLPAGRGCRGCRSRRSRWSRSRGRGRGRCGPVARGLQCCGRSATGPQRLTARFRPAPRTPHSPVTRYSPVPPVQTSASHAQPPSTPLGQPSVPSPD